MTGDGAPGGGTTHPDAPSYCGRPVLKTPVWEWKIAAYLFTGGLAAGTAGLAGGARPGGGAGGRPGWWGGGLWGPPGPPPVARGGFRPARGLPPPPPGGPTA